MSPSTKSQLLRWSWMTLLVAGTSTFAVLPACADDQQTPPQRTPSEQTPQQQQQSSQAEATQQPPVPPPLVSLTTGAPAELERQGDQLRAQKRYLDAIDYYDAATFARAYDWMKERGMSEGESQHAALVVG